MSDNKVYTPPKVWSPDEETGGCFAQINRPEAGARYDKALPVGKHPFQLYSLATPNGVKVTVMFEELLAHKHPGRRAILQRLCRSQPQLQDSGSDRLQRGTTHTGF